MSVILAPTFNNQMNLIENTLLLDHEIKTFFNTTYGPLCHWLLSALGLTFVITHSKLFAILRERLSMLKCAQCVGFWVGPFIYFLNSGIVNLFFSSSFICMVVYLLLAKSIKTHF